MLDMNISLKKLCRRVWVFFIIISSLFFSSCNNSREPAFKQETTSAEQTYYENPSGIVFIGDSNTAHLATYGLVDADRILTGSESYMTLEPDVKNSYVVCTKHGKEMTVSDAVALLNPEYAVISLGTDGALSLDREGVILSFSGLIESIKEKAPNTVVCLQAVPPVCQGSVGVRFHNVNTANQKFSNVNNWIKELAEDTGCIFIDSAAMLRDENGCLKAEYNTDHLDGYHLNRAGLTVMLDSICKTLNYEGKLTK